MISPSSMALRGNFLDDAAYMMTRETTNKIINTIKFLVEMGMPHGNVRKISPMYQDNCSF